MNASLIEKWFHWEGFAYPVSRIASVNQFEDQLMIVIDLLDYTKPSGEYVYQNYRRIFIKDPEHIKVACNLLGCDWEKISKVNGQRYKAGSRSGGYGKSAQTGRNSPPEDDPVPF